MVLSPSQIAIHAYRDLLRSARIAFQGDTRLLTGALSQARSAFEAGRSTSPSGPEFEAQLKHAGDVARLLRENVVQGASSGEDRYQLRIHEYTERGDNDSIKQAGKSTLATPMSGGCCGGAAATTTTTQ
ncbi:mitochondrial zinc maintenance protein 1 [Physcia stellaris]|nr:mitochondrial zinc maintenance protein 1 [Physcia stellaris]